MKRKVILMMLFIINTSLLLTGQKTYHFGERYPQQPSELPKSKTAFQQAVRVPKYMEEVSLKPINDTDFLLEKGWELAESEKVTASVQSIFDPAYNTGEWYNAVVPGTVLTTLVKQGIYPDPYWGLNNLSIPDNLCRKDWWYRLAFDLPQEHADKRVFLRLNGINYKAEIWFNYRLLGRMEGAFSRGEFDVTEALRKDKKNVVAVRILPPHNPGIPQEQNGESHGGNGGVLCLDGPTFISSEGWDWMPGIRDRNIGIWQDVILSFRRDVTLSDPQLITDLPLPDTSSAKITVKFDLTNSSDEPREASVKIQLEQITVNKIIKLNARETKKVMLDPEEYPQLNLPRPRLWWPNGYGNPELYRMNMTVLVNDRLSDEKTVRFGIRELEYELSLNNKKNEIQRFNFNPLRAYHMGLPVIDNLNKVEAEPGIFVPSLSENATEEGFDMAEETKTAPYLVVKVNGRRIYCKGGNWGMDDAMKRVSRERMEPYIRLHKEQGFTMIRNWTAESTEEVFYELCDEYGMLVFNDFGLSTENFNLLPSDYDLFLRNVNEIVVRFRNHPSIALWCPQNEGFPPAYLEKGISSIIAANDGTRHYIGNSRTLNSIKSGPWQYTLPVNYYKMAKGFASEVGTPSVPTAESMRKMMAEEDLWPIGDVWYYHDWLKGKWGTESLIQSYEDGINNQFGSSADADEFCKKAQLINYESYRTIFEGWNSRLFNSTTGVLLWMSHPAWPSLVWQTYSWDYETPGAYFGAKKACEPVHIQYNMLTNEIEVINTSLINYKGLTAIAGIYDLQGKKYREVKEKTSSSSNEAIRVMSLPVNNLQLPSCYFIRLELKDSKGKMISQNFYWMSSSPEKRDFKSLNELPITSVEGKVKASYKDGSYHGSVVLTNNSNKTAFALKLNVRNASTGEAILPAYFEAGYFTLFPGETETVKFDFPLASSEEKWKISVEGYNVRLQEISFLP